MYMLVGLLTLKCLLLQTESEPSLTFLLSIPLILWTVNVTSLLFKSQIWQVNMS